MSLIKGFILATATLGLFSATASAQVPNIPCPNPDGAGNEGNPGVSMSCFDFTAFVGGQMRIQEIADGFVAQGGRVLQQAVAGEYGTQTARTALAGQIDPLLAPDPRMNMNRAAIRAVFRQIFALNNPAYLARLGVPYNAANNVLMARTWLPLNQASKTQWTNAKNAALTAWQANQTQPNLVTYFRAFRLELMYEEMVGATQDVIAGN